MADGGWPRRTAGASGNCPEQSRRLHASIGAVTLSGWGMSGRSAFGIWNKARVSVLGKRQVRYGKAFHTQGLDCTPRTRVRNPRKQEHAVHQGHAGRLAGCDACGRRNDHLPRSKRDDGLIGLLPCLKGGACRIPLRQAHACSRAESPMHPAGMGDVPALPGVHSKVVRVSARKRKVGTVCSLSQLSSCSPSCSPSLTAVIPLACGMP